MITRFAIMFVACAFASSMAAAGGNFKTLSPSTCIPAQHDGKLTARLPAAWLDFERYTRICPLRKDGKSEAAVYLISVFIDEYYADHPGDRTWRNFPEPIFVAADGACLATLPEHFPIDEPRTLTVSFGRWSQNIPSRIVVHVSNPAEGGDYEMPMLVWEAQRRAYVPTGHSGEHQQGEMACPKMR